MEKRYRCPAFMLWCGILFVCSTAIIESYLVWFTENGMMWWAYSFPFLQLPTMHVMWTTLLGFSLITVATIWITLAKKEIST